MARCVLILILLPAMSTSALGDWTGTVSTQWDLAANWGGVLPSGGTSEARLEGYGTPPPGVGWPVIDSLINTTWGVARVRGPGLHLTQTGGMHEWPNASGRSSRGITIFSRPAAFPVDAGAHNPCIVVMTGGTMITDQVGLGTGGGLNSGCFYTDGLGGDYTLDTGTYRNWQTSASENPPRYGWGRLEIGGDATFIVRPNRYVFPLGHSEATPYWSLGGVPTDNKPYRMYDIGISRQSMLIIRDNGTLIAPLKIYYNANDLLADRDVLAQLKYYAGQVPAGSPPHFVPEIRFAAGEGQVLQFTQYPSQPVGGYFTVTAVPGTPPAWYLSATPEHVQTAQALEGSAALDPNLAIQPYLVGNSDYEAHTILVSEVDENGQPTDYAWLSLSASSLDLPARGTLQVTATLDHLAAALPPGVHTAYVKFTDSVDASQTQIREIRLTVLGCQWRVTPDSADLTRYYISGSGDPVGSAVFTIANTGKPGLTYTAQEVVDQSWLTLDKPGSAGSLAYQQTDTVTAAINPAGLAVGEYTCVVRLTSNCNPADVVDQSITLHVLPSDFTVYRKGLIAFYPFEDTLRDWTGHGYNGVVASGAPSYVESFDGRAIRFHGGGTGGDGANLGPIPSPSDTGNSKAMTVAVWYRSAQPAPNSWLVGKSTAAGGWWRGWHIKLDVVGSGAAVSFIWCHDGLRETLASGSTVVLPNLFDGNWHQIVMTIEDAPASRVNVRGYHNGQLISPAYERLNTTFEPAPVTQPVYASVSYQTALLGDLEDLSFWNRALTPEEIAYMFEFRALMPEPPPWPDVDEDGDVDMEDFAVFQRCYSGSGNPLTDPQTCARFDRDGDNDIDTIDMRQFSNCATGADVPFDPASPPEGCEL